MPFFYYYDPYYWMILVPAMLIALLAQLNVSSTFNRYSRMASRRGFTGAQAAEAVLRAHGIQNVRIERVSGRLTDHYDPRSNVIRLSDAVYGSNSIASVGVAAHEAGHAVVMHMLPGQDPVSQITIVPRGMAGGMTISLPEEDRSYLSKHYMEDQIVGLLGGRVAEKLCLNDISTGASNDIQRATAIARKMVTVYGMSERLGTVSFDSGNDEVFIGRTMGHSRGYSEAVAAQIDQEVKDLVNGAYRRCQDILEAQRDKLEQVAQYLLEHETMERDAFLTVFGEKTHEQPENVQTADAENQD